MAILPVGYPDEQPATPPRKELDEIAFCERYGQKKQKEVVLSHSSIEVYKK